MHLSAYQILFWLVNISLFISQLVVFYYLRRFIAKNKPVSPVQEEKILKDVRIKSDSILHRAIKKAQQIVVSAELKGVEMISKEKMDSTKLSHDYRKHLEQLESNLQSKFENNTLVAEKAYTDFIKTIELKLTQEQEKNSQILKERADALTQNTQKTIDSFVADVNKNIRTQVDQEIVAARAEIEEYKKHRMKIIDEKIIDMLEEIILVVLGKKLTLSDQSELIYKTLEDAEKNSALKTDSQ